MKNFCKTHTLVFILTIILIALASNLVPGFIQRLLDSNLAFSYIINSICKCAFSAIPLTLMVKWDVILTAGVAVHAKSIWPVVFWHGICDFGAFIVNGLIPQVSLNYFYEKNILSLQNVLNTYNILQRFKYGEELIHGCINLIFLIVGILLIRKAEKVQI